MIADYLFRAFQRQRLLQIRPYSDDAQQPVSYDLHLGDHALVFSQAMDGQIIDLGAHDPLMDHYTIPARESGRPFVILPAQFMLGRTLETLQLSARIAGEFMGKSTLGRVGLFVHVTAGLVDPGWGITSEHGNPLTVELYNASPCPIRLWVGMPIGQLVLHDLGRSVARPYGSTGLGNHYVHDRTVAGSRGFHEQSEAPTDIHARARGHAAAGGP